MTAGARRRLSLKDKLAIVLRYCSCACGCGNILGSDVEWDHIHSLALGGTDTNMNLRPIRSECHARKSFGSHATSAGSDAHKRAKGRRIQRKLSEHYARMASKGEPEEPRKSRWPKRKLRG